MHQTNRTVEVVLSAVEVVLSATAKHCNTSGQTIDMHSGNTPWMLTNIASRNVSPIYLGGMQIGLGKCSRRIDGGGMSSELTGMFFYRSFV